MKGYPTDKLKTSTYKLSHKTIHWGLQNDTIFFTTEEKEIYLLHSLVDTGKSVITNNSWVLSMHNLS